MGDAKDKINPFKRILFYTDFSINAESAFDYALEMVAPDPDSVLYLLHVIPESDAQFWKTYLSELNHIDEKAKKDINDKIAQSYSPSPHFSPDRRRGKG